MKNDIFIVMESLYDDENYIIGVFKWKKLALAFIKRQPKFYHTGRKYSRHIEKWEMIEGE